MQEIKLNNIPPSLVKNLRRTNRLDLVKSALRDKGIHITNVIAIDFCSAADTRIICINNKLTSLDSYNKFRKDNQHLQLHSQPWESFENKTITIYFSEIKDCLGFIHSYTEIKNLCIINKLITPFDYKKYREANPSYALPSVPWAHKLNGVKQNSIVYFSEIKKQLGIGSIKTPEETRKICIDNKLTDSGLYKKFRRNNPELYLHTQPWLKTTSILYFSEIKKQLGIGSIKTPEETRKICIDNKIVTQRGYIEFRKKNPELNLHSSAWDQVNKTILDYFIDIKKELGLTVISLSLDETRKICIDNKLMGHNTYIKFRNANPNLNLPSEPIKRHGSKSKREFYADIRDALGLTILNPNDTRKVCIDNKLTDTGKYKRFRKNVSNLPSDPWLRERVTPTEYFNTIQHLMQDFQITS